MEGGHGEGGEYLHIVCWGARWVSEDGYLVSQGSYLPLFLPGVGDRVSMRFLDDLGVSEGHCCNLLGRWNSPHHPVYIRGICPTLITMVILRTLSLGMGVTLTQGYIDSKHNCWHSGPYALSIQGGGSKPLLHHQLSALEHCQQGGSGARTVLKPTSAPYCYREYVCVWGGGGGDYSNTT